MSGLYIPEDDPALYAYPPLTPEQRKQALEDARVMRETGCRDRATGERMSWRQIMAVAAAYQRYPREYPWFPDFIERRRVLASPPPRPFPLWGKLVLWALPVGGLAFALLKEVAFNHRHDTT